MESVIIKSIKSVRRALGKAAIAAMVFVSPAAGAAGQGDKQSCAYFSTDPDDRGGPPIHFSAELWDGPQRLPTESPGTGRADFVLERDTLKLSWRVTFQDLTSQPVGLHVHGPVPAEGTAPVMFDLTMGAFASPVEGEKVLTIGEVTNLVQNLSYVNLHTTRYPEGELRGPVRKQRPAC